MNRHLHSSTRTIATTTLPWRQITRIMRLTAVALFVVRRVAWLKHAAKALLSCLTLTMLVLLLGLGGALWWLAAWVF